jgi:hypothetical protein
MKIEQGMSILLNGKQERRQNLPPLPIVSMQNGQNARRTLDLVPAAASAAAAAAAAAVTTSAAATTAAAASATAATVTTAATTTTAATGAGAIFAGLGHINGKGSAGMILAVQRGNSRLCLGFRSHLDESKAFGAAGIAVSDHFGGLDGTMCLKQRLQIGASHVIAQIANIQLAAHRNSPKKSGT